MEFEPAIIEKALMGFSMLNNIADSDARIIHFSTDLLERFEGFGYGSFRETNPKKTISLMPSSVVPAALKREMRRRINFDEDLEKNLKKLIKVLSIEAVNCQAYATDVEEPPERKSCDYYWYSPTGRRSLQGRQEQLV